MAPCGLHLTALRNIRESLISRSTSDGKAFPPFGKWGLPSFPRTSLGMHPAALPRHRPARRSGKGPVPTPERHYH